ncbi:Asp23/Gls24 family envelope stress response protein [Actinomycetospora chiangmaiensis]|uniref:Asp23/Gls24 family envelope stress response protein n=1 Tax=Actinomycetospora chiangmaiensis TaxID=402650 RepID=UPI000380FCEC|nr:Asp23/Gls24 family envelope stress response protein [Actinomycetospora chiangmaiensis]
MTDGPDARPTHTDGSADSPDAGDSAVDLLGIDAALPCGRDPQPLLEQVTEHGAVALDDHQRGCLHCQAALAEFDRLWAPMRSVAADRPQAPPGVLDSVLMSIRGVSEDAEFARIDEGYGHTRISGRVVAAIARHHAARVAGVRGALGKLDRAGHRRGAPDPDFPETSVHSAQPSDMARGPQASAGVAGTSTAIEIVLAADYGRDLQALADQVRAAVVAGVRANTGLEPVSVSVVIDEVLLPREASGEPAHSNGA